MDPRPPPRPPVAHAARAEAVAVVVCVTGSARYFRAVRETIRSVLAHSPFPVLAGVGPGEGRLWLRSPRLRRLPLDALPARTGRSGAFLLAFRALEAALGATDASHLLLLDADTVMVRRTSAADATQALDGRPLGMVEQTGILGGRVDGAELRRFAFETMLPFFGPVPAGLGPEDLVYFNSGVVLGHREELARLAAWALRRIEEAGPAHDLGEHMVGDQDYFQYWANVLHPGVCRRLPWSWNHCEHWDASFPHADARIVHLSNFCHGPGRDAIRRLRAARRRGVSALAARRPAHVRGARAP